MKEIFTIGHSTHTIEYFLHLLRLHKINCLVDVRSTPYSRYASQFNSEQLKKFLKENDMHYIFMGKELGARWEDRSLYTKEGYLDFEEVRKTSLFNSGIRRVEDGIAKGFNIAIMCTEKDPIDCHRTILVAPKIHNNGYEVKNILENGDVQIQEDIENRLLDLYFPDRMQVTIFEVLGDKKSDAQLIKEAYKLRNRDIGYNIEKEKIEVIL